MPAEQRLSEVDSDWGQFRGGLSRAFLELVPLFPIPACCRRLLIFVYLLSLLSPWNTWGMFIMPSFSSEDKMYLRLRDGQQDRACVHVRLCFRVLAMWKSAISSEWDHWDRSAREGTYILRHVLYEWTCVFPHVTLTRALYSHRLLESVFFNTLPDTVLVYIVMHDAVRTFQYFCGSAGETHWLYNKVGWVYRLHKEAHKEVTKFGPAHLDQTKMFGHD